MVVVGESDGATGFGDAGFGRFGPGLRVAFVVGRFGRGVVVGGVVGLGVAVVTFVVGRFGRGVVGVGVVGLGVTAVTLGVTRRVVVGGVVVDVPAVGVAGRYVGTVILATFAVTAANLFVVCARAALGGPDVDASADAGAKAEK